MKKADLIKAQSVYPAQQQLRATFCAEHGEQHNLNQLLLGLTAALVPKKQLHDTNGTFSHNYPVSFLQR